MGWWVEATAGKEQQMAPGMGCSQCWWWPRGGTSSFHSYPVHGQIHTVSVHWRQGLPAVFLSSHGVGISLRRVLSSHLPKSLVFQLCS